MPTFSKNGIEQKIFYNKFLMYQFKKLFRLFLEIAPMYKKQNKLISKTGVLISRLLLLTGSETHTTNILSGVRNHHSNKGDQIFIVSVSFQKMLTH